MGVMHRFIHFIHKSCKKTVPNFCGIGYNLWKTNGENRKAPKNFSKLHFLKKIIIVEKETEALG